MNRSSFHEVSYVYTSLFLDTGQLKMASRVRNVSGAFEKRAPGVFKAHVRCVDSLKFLRCCRWSPRVQLVRLYLALFVLKF